MTNSYSGDPASSSKDAVRFWIEDTGPTTWDASDEEINYVLETFPSPIMAAAKLARAFAAKAARLVDRRVGDLSINYSQRSKAWLSLAATLEAQAELASVGSPYVGGVSVADIERVNANTDRVNPPFSNGQFDHPASESPRSDPNQTFIAGDWGAP